MGGGGRGERKGLRPVEREEEEAERGPQTSTEMPRQNK